METVRMVDGCTVMLLSRVDSRRITKQEIVEGMLVTAFREDPDELIGHPAGIIICRPFTDADREEYRLKAGGCSCCGGEWAMSDTVTRLGRVFFDQGEFSYVPQEAHAKD